MTDGQTNEQVDRELVIDEQTDGEVRQTDKQMDRDIRKDGWMDRQAH